jgi:methionine sulfoxide reductase catalytic subunit
MVKIDPSEITPESLYLSRREFIRGIGVVGVGAMLLAACGVSPGTATKSVPTVGGEEGKTDELGNPLTPYDTVIGYNNFYEFTTNKEDVAEESKNFTTQPWNVTVGGLVNKPRTFSIDDLIKQFSPEERIYRLRCVETWSMVIPWIGFSLKKLLDEVEPTSSAKFVRFQSILDPEQMPGQRNKSYQWPYIEGLRLDEAMNELTILATGLYGKPLPNQDGAPIRLVVPWKYGFKSIKSIVNIDLVEEMPVSFWMAASPYEYGFYANVNPNVNHPRWSQATERRIGEQSSQPTLMFNGYEEEVAYLYEGMDLSVNF